MFRLIGFISGVAISAVLLTTLVDAPSVDAIREVADRLWQRDATSPNDMQSDREPLLPNPEREDITSGPQNAVDRDTGASDQVPPQTEISTIESAQRSQDALGSETKPIDPGTSWHAVWNPFRSELSASGFAERLARLTDREYRVRRISVGAYQVEVGYNPEIGVADTLVQIRLMTGLRIREIQP
jgi:hypothetical protein